MEVDELGALVSRPSLKQPSKRQVLASHSHILFSSALVTSVRLMPRVWVLSARVTRGSETGGGAGAGVAAARRGSSSRSCRPGSCASGATSSRARA
jgi:hypothetical protein